MTTSVTERAEATVLTVAGDVDLATAPALENALDAALAGRPTALVVDLSAVSFLASAGMAVLVGAHKRAGDTRIAVVADGPATSRQLKVTSLDQVFSLHPTLEEALAALG
ncbi:anti-sigma factor antagonist [Nocardia yunnanensis]|uniref:Anti-sigma factor antagonist n=1 Tax=Nocardia yunnanensis TaxID=2382165 RepID=A0A386ZN14_9NOCA|nr:STAS domain-containing protein [Nocardia yunnanensis]AYF78846.1 anti-sigma factor antagonist [Nocardia yunnanensis]